MHTTFDAVPGGTVRYTFLLSEIILVESATFSIGIRHFVVFRRVRQCQMPVEKKKHYTKLEKERGSGGGGGFNYLNVSSSGLFEYSLTAPDLLVSYG